MKKKYANALINGVKGRDFPHLPVDYGYRDSKNFWYHRWNFMHAELLQMRQASLESVRYAADRIDDTDPPGFCNVFSDQRSTRRKLCQRNRTLC